MPFKTPQEIFDHIQGVIGEEGVLGIQFQEWPEGTKGIKSKSVWMRVQRERFKMAVRALCDIDYPHMAVISGADLGDDIELLYHFYVYYGHLHQEILVTIAVALPKTDPTIPTITDIIPGTLISEREKQEMLGVRVIDIPDSRRIFLPEDFPEGVYPWRNDETGIPEDMIKQLWQVGRPAELMEQPKPKEPAPETAPAAEAKPVEAETPAASDEPAEGASDEAGKTDQPG
jgi:membrane-bound hydrogenase subunit beta